MPALSVMEFTGSSDRAVGAVASRAAAVMVLIRELMPDSARLIGDPANSVILAVS